jgi:hypothetical protein
LVSINWTGPANLAINASTGIINALPSVAPVVYTLKYTASNHCTAQKTAKIYLHVIKDKKVFAPRDTVSVCWKYAEALQMNQIFGIEATGVWTTAPTLTSEYLRQSPNSSPYSGAVIFNGKAAYENNILPSITYHGILARKIEFYYTVPADNCFGAKTYKVVIILTPNIMK